MLPTSAIYSFALSFAILSSAVSVPAENVVPKANLTDRKWWETAVVYQIYPRSFKDSNGDGVGDLIGITSKLDHLKDIGAGAVWLSPIYPSPQADFGYDISNFVDVDPQYGTLADFDKLVVKAKELGLKVILDFVPNHSSDEHEWFKKSVDRVPPYSDYYVWADGKTINGRRTPPNNWISVFRGSAWEWNEQRQQYYLHQFAVKQPDLNYNNPDVVKEMKDAIRFWLRRGVDGFRVDAIPHLFETGLQDEPPNPGNDDKDDHGHLNHTFTVNQPKTFEMVQQWREVLEEKEFGEDRLMMTEAYASMDDTMKYYGTPDRPGAHFSFNFLLITDLGRSSNAVHFKDTIHKWMDRMSDFRRANWVIGNHDQFRVAGWSRYGPELSDGLNMISLMLPGTAMTYNGEEIGMEDTFIRWDQTLDPQAKNKGEKDYMSVSRDPERTPFQWDDTTSAGFSTNATTWLPVNPNYWRLNLASQKAASKSHYHVYKALTEARKHPTVQGRRNYRVDTIGKYVLVLHRELAGNDTFVVVVNFGSEAVEIESEQISHTPLSVWTSSVHSAIEPGTSVANNTLKLLPKAGVVLSSAKTPSKPNSASQQSLALPLTVLSLILSIAYWN